MGDPKLAVKRRARRHRASNLRNDGPVVHHIQLDHAAWFAVFHRLEFIKEREDDRWGEVGHEKLEPREGEPCPEPGVFNRSKYPNDEGK